MKLTIAELMITRDALNELISVYVTAQRYLAAHEAALIREKVQAQIDNQIDPK